MPHPPTRKKKWKPQLTQKRKRGVYRKIRRLFRDNRDPEHRKQGNKAGKRNSIWERNFWVQGNVLSTKGDRQIKKKIRGGRGGKRQWVDKDFATGFVWVAARLHSRSQKKRESENMRG